MRELLQELQFVQGVVGSMVFVEGRDIVFSNIPKEFDDFLMEQTGRVIGRILSIRENICENIDSLIVSYKEHTLICFSVRKGAALIVLGDPSARPDLVAMTASGIITELASGLGDVSVASGAGAQAEPSPKEMPPALLTALPKLKDELTRYIGPVAPIVLDGYIQNCLKSGQDENTCWKKFEEALLSEIDDTADKASFKQKFTSIVSSARSASADKTGARGAATPETPGKPNTPGLEQRDLKALEALMAKSIGPIAAMIISDNVKKWQRNPKEGKPELLRLLALEIDDKKEQKAFLEEAGKILK